jgi:hypothetical protein
MAFEHLKPNDVIPKEFDGFAAFYVDMGVNIAYDKIKQNQEREAQGLEPLELTDEEFELIGQPLWEVTKKVKAKKAFSRDDMVRMAKEERAERAAILAKIFNIVPKEERQEGDEYDDEGEYNLTVAEAMAKMDPPKYVDWANA